MSYVSNQLPGVWPLNTPCFKMKDILLIWSFSVTLLSNNNYNTFLNDGVILYSVFIRNVLGPLLSVPDQTTATGWREVICDGPDLTWCLKDCGALMCWQILDVGPVSGPKVQFSCLTALTGRVDVTFPLRLHCSSCLLLEMKLKLKSNHDLCVVKRGVV